MEISEFYSFILYCLGFGMFAGILWALLFDFPKWR